MKLDAYLERIAHNGPVRADLATLDALHRAHLRAIPFENIDVLLERKLSLEPEAVFDKLVTRRRGGWCYEMNGLFGWVLGEIGFDVRRISAGVRRAKRGDEMLGNHLCLMVRLGEGDAQDYLVDVGFGGAQDGPIPLDEGVTNHPPVQMALVRIDNGFWRLHEGGPGAASSYDFRSDAGDEAQLAERYAWQVATPESIFRQNLSVSRREGNAIIRLRGRLLEKLSPGRMDKRVMDDFSALAGALADNFGLCEPELETMWPQLCERHASQFPQG